MEKTSESLANQILDVVPVIMQQLRTEMRAHRTNDLSVVQFRALNFLHRSPGSSLAELAEHIGLTPSTTSALVDGLVKKGLLLRVEASGDRRRLELRLSEAGCSALEEARQGARESLVNRLDMLSMDDRLLVHEAMDILAGLYLDTAG